MLPCSHAILIFVLCLAFQGIRCQFDSEKTNFGLGKPPVSWSPPEFDPNDYAQDKLGDNEYCECVYFYQCDKNTRRIIDTGGGLVTWRISLRISQNNGPRKCIEVGQICCKLPLWAEQATDIPELIPLGTPSSSDQQPALPDEQQNPSDIKDEFDPDQDNEPPQDNPDSAEGNKPNKHDQAEPWPDDSNNPKEPNNDKEEPQIVEETQEDDDEDESKEVVQPLRCGERRTIVDYRLQSVASRVSGGDLETETKFGEFPWMVMLQYIEIHNESNNEIPLFLCGASLIHPQILLTAAHCIEGRELSKLRARAGEYDATSNAESLPHQDQDIESIVIHPSYNQTHPRHDIALMLLKNPFTLGDHINTICLPTDESYDPQRCVGIGWGIDNSGKRVGESQHLLRKAFLPLVPKRECQKLLRKTRLGRYFKLHSSFLCAGGQSDLDLCVGDGGGPLTCYNPKTDSEVQVGVTSWGIGCGTKDVPGVYADVAVDNDWISSTSNYLLNGYHR